MHLTTKTESRTLLYQHSLLTCQMKIEAFFQNLLQQMGVKGQPDSEAQKPGPLREDSEQDTERLKVNTNVLYVVKIIKHRCFMIIMLNSISFRFLKSSS